MHRKAAAAALCCATTVFSITGCNTPISQPSLSNARAIDSALRLCALTHGEEPFHLILEITPPANPSSSSWESDPRSAANFADMSAEVEIYWLNPLTYRTVIRSRTFTQTRIVNPAVVEEHDTGDYYPRWIQNFVDALLEPIPNAASLRKVPGDIPIGPLAHACITGSSPAGTSMPGDSGSGKVGPVDSMSGNFRSGALPAQSSTARVCFLDADPKLASGSDFSRNVSFDGFAPFGSQQIARTLINVLPANVLVPGHITRLEPFPDWAYPLLKTKEYTPQPKRIQTTLVSEDEALALLTYAPANISESSATRGAFSETRPDVPPVLYIRTDRTGRVREAYRDPSDIYNRQNLAVSQALSLRFRPLIVNGIPQQMEAPISLPLQITVNPRSVHRLP